MWNCKEIYGANRNENYGKFSIFPTIFFDSSNVNRKDLSYTPFEIVLKWVLSHIACHGIIGRRNIELLMRNKLSSRRIIDISLFI